MITVITGDTARDFQDAVVAYLDDLAIKLASQDYIYVKSKEKAMHEGRKEQTKMLASSIASWQIEPSTEQIEPSTD